MGQKDKKKYVPREGSTQEDDEEEIVQEVKTLRTPQGKEKKKSRASCEDSMEENEDNDGEEDEMHIPSEKQKSRPRRGKVHAPPGHVKSRPLHEEKMPKQKLRASRGTRGGKVGRRIPDRGKPWKHQRLYAKVPLAWTTPVVFSIPVVTFFGLTGSGG